MRRVLNYHYVRVYSSSIRQADVNRKCARHRLGSIWGVVRLGCYSSDASEPGNKHCLSRSTEGDGRLQAPASALMHRSRTMVQNMETYHEGSYRCSRVGHAGRCPNAPRERVPNVPGEFLIRVERLLIDDKPDQRPKVSGRAYRDEPASSVTDIGLTMVSAGRARSPQPSRR